MYIYRQKMRKVHGRGVLDNLYDYFHKNRFWSKGMRFVGANDFADFLDSKGLGKKRTAGGRRKIKL